MTVVVNIHSEQEEIDLVAFLESKKYDFRTEVSLTKEQEEEILNRDKSFSEGITRSRPWSEVKQELSSVYR